MNCKQQVPKSVIITVISKVSNVVQRETIRRTWGNLQMQAKYNFSLYFLLGTEENFDLKDEIILNGDIIQADIMEDYYHLTEKSIEAFKWITLFCHKADYFFKTDDDVFFDLEFLREVQNDGDYLMDDVILGHCVFKGMPSRVEGTKYEITKDEYPFRFYPPYCGGPGYLMTLNTARKIYSEMLTTRNFKYEDVYLGIVIYRLGLKLKHIDCFVYLKNEKKEKELEKNSEQYCNVRCSRVIHGLKPGDIQHYWDTLGTERRNRKNCDDLEVH
ncbi:UDP-GalNAc:beta-1,3-N-acetylgalactosaminyltransferase 1-like [Ylistrum balloti]|uniref:UDP-GalNAc:beta-1, 3-N-acetylgalactosaminyltransferase 1-like n=1 Tax=Ylistrum balloti TaxID=509963 RepID=UPI002905EDBD|nr:UDP-GalNAc:beta-1,3-N-acetylgalactosaminyltransferase 1-like [Ylistrum balloti]